MSPNSSMKRSLFASRSGFTMLEIMMVVVIIVLLLGFAVGKLKGNVDKAKEVRIAGDLSSIGTQLMLYESNGFLPTTEQGLKAMVTRPESEPKPRSWRQLMKEVPTDPYDMEYQYVQPGVHNTDSYDLFSAGKDRTPGTADDQGNWK